MAAQTRYGRFRGRLKDGIHQFWGVPCGGGALSGQAWCCHPSIGPVAADTGNHAAQPLIAAYDPLEDNADIQCRQGMPDTMYDPTFLEITNLGDTIVMHVQEFNIHRTIHMTENDPKPSNVGYSTGRWDGEMLIVNTTHVDWPYWSEIPVPQSDQTSYLERFSISDGGRTLHHSITITDPVVFAEPFTIERTREWTPGVALMVRECVDWPA